MLEGQQGVSWDGWVEVARTAEALGAETLYSSDHYFASRGVGGRGSSDAWTVLAGLAAVTTRIRLGTLVSPVTFREPALLAKVATTVDHISSGRVEIGMGAGWWEEEHRQHGFAFPDVGERFDRLAEQIEIVHRLLTEDEVTFTGEHYRLEGAAFWPKPVQRPHPPLTLGGTTVGPRMQRLIGRWADGFNTVGGTPDEVAGRFTRARAGVEAAGRDPASFPCSLMTWTYVGTSEDQWVGRAERAHALDPDAGPFDRYLDDLRAEMIVGTPDEAATRIRAYRDAGADAIVLNHELYDDLEMIELLATEVLPRV
jgi:F420-dependent oxidoreductase-like protein